MERAREVAESIVAADPDLDDHPTLLEEVRSLLDQANADFLFKS